MAKILKNLAIAAGAGLGIGLTAIVIPKRSEPEDILDLEPLLDRIEAVERRLDSTSPALDSAAIEALEAKFQSKLDAVRRETLDAFDKAFEAAISREVSRQLEPIEKTLADHAVAIAELRNQERLTDENLQRLIAAVERLVTRDPAPAPAAANSPFEDHLKEAMRPPRGSRILGL